LENKQDALHVRLEPVDDNEYMIIAKNQIA